MNSILYIIVSELKNFSRYQNNPPPTVMFSQIWTLTRKYSPHKIFHLSESSPKPDLSPVFGHQIVKNCHHAENVLNSIQKPFPGRLNFVLKWLLNQSKQYAGDSFVWIFFDN